ncbi:Arc family DNA-binding protein [Pararhizobium sp. DWP1-1-3]|uniref:Arc family DNA-binding protein n=1 Tax=Pararhizobium sp. DWP1-1-3 TaxID=2804652 RepID=UPI003CEB97ED
MLDPEVRITLRLPQSLRDKLQDASLRGKRSMNGEIVERIDYTFERLEAQLDHVRTTTATRLADELQARRVQLSEAHDEIKRLSAQLDMRDAERATLQAELQDIRERYEERRYQVVDVRALQAEMERNRHILYVLLDADGQPISWPEIMAHLGEIVRNSVGAIDKIEAIVFDAEKASSDERMENWIKLREHYRSLRASGQSKLIDDGD